MIKLTLCKNVVVSQESTQRKDRHSYHAQSSPPSHPDQEINTHCRLQNGHYKDVLWAFHMPYAEWPPSNLLITSLPDLFPLHREKQIEIFPVLCSKIMALIFRGYLDHNPVLDKLSQVLSQEKKGCYNIQSYLIMDLASWKSSGTVAAKGCCTGT